MHHGNSSLVAILITLAVVLPILYFRTRRSLKSRPLKLDQLWIRPAMLLVFAALVLFQMPPGPGDWVWLGPALAAGSALGWYWGKTTAIHIDPESKGLMGQGTPMAAYFLVGLIVLRLGLRTGLNLEAHDWRISPALITDAFMLFALALYVTRTLEMFLRARRVIAGRGP